MTDTEYLQAQIRSLETEVRALRETLHDRFAMAALTGLLANGEDEYTIPEAADDAWRFADAMLESRKGQQ